MRQRRWPMLIIVLMLLLAAPTWAEVCKGSKIPRAELQGYDAQAVLSAADQESALRTHLPWGQVACPKLLPSTAYVICYDPVAKIALWASYHLTAEDLLQSDRRDAFRTDPRLTDTESAHCDDYAGSGYDRGHVVPNSDMGRTPQVQAGTFYLSNMTPQSPALNRGMWRWLEELVRTYVKQYGTLHIVTGAVVPENAPTVPSGNVRVPAQYYKALLRTDSSGTPATALTILLPNLPDGIPVPPGTRGVTGQKVSGPEADAYLKGHLVSIKELERQTGLALLPKLDAESLKTAVASELWPRN